MRKALTIFGFGLVGAYAGFYYQQRDYEDERVCIFVLLF